jgi:DNA-directed RNA polymerase II subunit RPB2
LFRSAFFRSYHSQEKKSYKKNETFEIPNRDVTDNIRHGLYNKLDSDGLISPAIRVSGDDICIGKTDYLGTNKENESRGNRKTKKDISVSIRPTENGIIDSVNISLKLGNAYY